MLKRAKEVAHRQVPLLVHPLRQALQRVGGADREVQLLAVVIGHRDVDVETVACIRKYACARNFSGVFSRIGSMNSLIFLRFSGVISSLA
jgi:hypothetical protein